MSSRTLLLLVVWASAPGGSPAHAQAGPFVEASAEVSPVKTGGVATMWHMARLAGGVQVDGRFGWLLAVERHRRGAAVDWAAEARGFRRTAPWTIAGAVAATAQPDFNYRHAVEGELARDIGGGFVAHGGYRHLRFRTTSVHIVQPALSWYRGDHEVQARGYVVRNMTTSENSLTVLLRASVQTSPRVRLGAGAAVGSRIFDATTAATSARGWVAYATAHVRIARHMMIVGGFGGAAEEPLFTQRTVSLGTRWIF